jgi:MFS family permease
VLATLIVGAVALLGFVFVERRGRDPMVPPSLFRSREFDGANLVTLLFYMALTGSLYFLPFLMMQVHGYSALVAGSVFLPFVAMALLLGRLSGRICARFGTKVPLVVASLAVVAGLLMFALPGVERGSYWTSFFPAMVVQGFGMVLVITPLTAVALGSVESEHSGLASGVNNAMARVAGLLAVAVLGVFAYGAFSATLDARLESMDLSGEVRSELEAAKGDLGAAEAPEGVDAGTAAQIERAIDESFVAGFRAVMLVSAALALMSALVAVLLVGGRRTRSASGYPLRQTVAARKGQILRPASREEGAAREGRAPQPVTVNPT